MMNNAYFAGIDGGSTFLKVALIHQGQVVDLHKIRSGIDNSAAAERLLNEMAERNGIGRSDIKYTMATGYSRKIIDTADDDISEITAHAYGAKLTAPKGFRPGLLIDIGGQDSKIIYLDEGFGVRNFNMNDKCAAGTGKFMETAAQILDTDIEKIGELSVTSKEPCDINSTCIVFAQSEIISLIARRHTREDILAGMHLSMARRVIKMIRKRDANGDIMLTGGGALNIGLHKAFEDELMTDVYRAEHPQFCGAIGAACLAAEQYEAMRTE